MVELENQQKKIQTRGEENSNFSESFLPGVDLWTV
jgi:hypothetical protein